uniref:Uncharacterized protein n=1 Tax=Pipistrellus kuhlii TaxID=59472 RepID=A0A7J7X0Y0_PIPKU|nr:hypothetical protein mPipKuh1_010760 [Pipistrellus kuhlii]
MPEFMECNLNELVKHNLRALRETIPTEQDLTTKNVSIGPVSKDLEFMIYNDDDDVSPFLEGLEERPQRKAQPAQPADEPAEKADEPIEYLVVILHSICVLSMCENTGTCTDDNNLYFEPKGSFVKWYVSGIRTDVNCFQAPSLKPY